MNIIHIEILNKNNLYKVTKANIWIGAVVITYRTFWGTIKKTIAYPTDNGAVRRSDDSILYMHYVDENGKQFSGEVCQQIYNFFSYKKLENKDDIKN